MYAGLPLPSRAKRSAEASAAADDTPQEPDARRAKRRKSPADQPLDLPATVAKLKSYMVRTHVQYPLGIHSLSHTLSCDAQLVEKKFPKASELFARLATEKMDVGSRALFMDALADVVAATGDKWSGSKELEALVQQVVGKFETLSDGDDDATRREFAKRIADWQLLGVTHAQLFTDETYQFVKAAKVVKTRLESLPTSLDSGEDDDSAGEFALVMPLLRTLFAKHSTPWARAMVEAVLAVATHKRLRFRAEHRREVDAWTAAILERRSAPASARSAGSDARRNIVAASGSQATLKVGRVNHPLFNKEV